MKRQLNSIVANPKTHVNTAILKFLRLGLAVTLLAFPCFILGKALAQEPVDKPNDEKSPVSTRLRALDQLKRDYGAFLEKRTRLSNSYQGYERTLRDTENDLRTINNEGVRQQFELMRSTMLASSGADLLNTVGTNGAPAGLPRGANYVGAIAQVQLMDQLNAAMRAEEIRQLDSTAQATLRRRLECFQGVVKVQREWTEWQSEWPKYMDRYWSYGDPERQFAKSENQLVLDALQTHGPENYPALIVSAMLMERMGNLQEAKGIIDRVIRDETGLQAVAIAVRAMLFTALDDAKQAKVDLAKAIKLDRVNPHVRWIRAQLAAQRQDWSTAETEWKSLASTKEHEIAARRCLALLSSLRAKRSPREGAKALMQAQLAADLTPSRCWYSSLVLAIAQYAAKNDAEAVKLLTSAEKEADEENLELCKEIRTKIADRAEVTWDFLRR